MAQTVKNANIRQVILVGNTTNPKFPTATPAIAKVLQLQGVNNITSLVKPGGPTIQEIVGAARNAAKAGDVVLLSAGCASFDIFNNYKERGEKFTEAVLKLV